MSLLSTQPFSRCPMCGSVATRIHSRYQQTLADLPSGGQPVRFQLSVRKFFCDAPPCIRKIFTERLLPFVAPWARVTARRGGVTAEHASPSCASAFSMRCSAEGKLTETNSFFYRKKASSLNHQK